MKVLGIPAILAAPEIMSYDEQSLIWSFAGVIDDLLSDFLAGLDLPSLDDCS